MDNKHISITLGGRAAFDLAIKVAFMTEYDKDEPLATATHYFEDEEKGLVFLWHEDKSVNSVKLPIPLDWKGTADLAWRWLEGQPNSAYKDDGGNSRGFRVYNEGWGHVKSHYAIIAVLPVWAWHRK